MTPARLLLRVMAALLPVFSIWWLCGSQWLQPAVGLAENMLSVWLPRIFHELIQNGDSVQALTHWERVGDYLVPAAQVGTCIAFDANLRLLSYSFPFYVALQIALWEWCGWIKTALALLALYLVLVVSLTFVVAKEIMLGLEAVFLETSMHWYTYPDFIIMGYQVAVLLLPALVPILLWVAVNQNVLRRHFGLN
ncbi:MAG: exosortase H-associated membrane protein [Gammaproteobacteria bacterium]